MSLFSLPVLHIGLDSIPLLEVNDCYVYMDCNNKHCLGSYNTASSNCAKNTWCCAFIAVGCNRHVPSCRTCSGKYMIVYIFSRTTCSLIFSKEVCDSFLNVTLMLYVVEPIKHKFHIIIPKIKMLEYIFQSAPLLDNFYDAANSICCFEIESIRSGSPSRFRAQFPNHNQESRERYTKMMTEYKSGVLLSSLFSVIHEKMRIKYNDK